MLVVRYTRWTFGTEGYRKHTVIAMTYNKYVGLVDMARSFNYGAPYLVSKLDYIPKLPR